MLSRNAFRHALVSSAVALTAVATGAAGMASASSPGDLAPTATTTSASPLATKAGHVATIENGALWLVSPTGTRTRIATVADSGLRLADVSASGRRYLFLSRVDDQRSRITTYDADASAWTSFTTVTTSSIVTAVRFTTPTSASIWVTRVGIDGNSPLVERRATTGAVQLRITGASAVLPAPDGLTFVTAGASGRLVIHENATGALRQVLPSPSDRACVPIANWDAGQFIADCTDRVAMRMDVYRYRWSGGAPAALTRAAQPFGYDTAWRTSRGIIASEAIQGTGDGFGYTPAPGRYTHIAAPFDTWGMSAVVGAVGTKVYVMGSKTAGTNSLYAYDLDTKRVTRLAGDNSHVVERSYAAEQLAASPRAPRATAQQRLGTAAQVLPCGAGQVLPCGAGQA